MDVGAARVAEEATARPRVIVITLLMGQDSRMEAPKSQTLAHRSEEGEIGEEATKHDLGYAGRCVKMYKLEFGCFYGVEIIL